MVVQGIAMSGVRAAVKANNLLGSDYIDGVYAFDPEGELEGGDNVDLVFTDLSIAGVLAFDPEGDLEAGDDVDLAWTQTQLTYQHYQDGVAIDGATDAVLSLTDIDETANGSYTLRATNPITGKFKLFGPLVIDGVSGVSVTTYPILLENGLPLLLENGQTLELQNGGNAISITSPSSYQVFQRNGSNQADIEITGTYAGTPTAVEARWSGGSWSTIDAAPAAGAFTGTLSAQATGQGTLEVRFTNETGTRASAEFVGVGEVFACWGQSNMSGRGNNNQIQTHATLRAGLFGNDYTWKVLADPYDSNSGKVDGVSSEAQAAGSFVVHLANQLMTTLSAPVAFVPCALGGTSITSWTPTANHLDRTKLYGSGNYRTQQVGGARCVLWWQGETDALAAMAEATYNGHLDTLANAIGTDLGIKLMACKLQNSSGITDADELKINDAIGTAWSDNANVATGPDLTAYGSDDDYHLITEENLLIAATAWHDAIVAEYFT